MTTHRQFFEKLIPMFGFPAREPAVRACAVVSILESPGGDNHWNNPLAVTQDWPGATPYNFDDNHDPLVWRYLTVTDGVQATATLLNGPRWSNVRRAMKFARSRNEVLDAFSATYATWGSHVDFVGLPYNNRPSIRHRLNHTLQPYAPKDPWQR